MGISIGTSSRAFAAPPPVAPVRPERPPVHSGASTEVPQLIRQPEAPRARVGFGENTLSLSGAALEALDSNLEVALRLVPTVEQLRARAQVTQAQRPDAIELRAEQERPQEPRRREPVRPDPSSDVQNFVTETELVAVSDRPAVGFAEPPDRSDPASGKELAAEITRLDLRA